MQLTVLISAFLLPAVSLTHDPSPLLADDGRDLSFLLKRYDGPVPILRQAVKGKRHIVPRTLQVEQVQVSRAFNGLLERHECPDAGTVVCPSNTQCCPEGSVCGPGFCCPSGNLACTGNCCPDSLGDCCPNVGCCKAGHACFTAVNGTAGCCPRGTNCTTVNGCAEHGLVECPGELFCCRPGTTCTRDASGTAHCLDPTKTDVTFTPNAMNPAPTPGGSNAGGSNGNTNTNKNINSVTGAALPQVAAASGLMVTLAFLSAFLASVSQNI